jgi:hypothetical protein
VRGVFRAGQDRFHSGAPIALAKMRAARLLDHFVLRGGNSEAIAEVNRREAMRAIDADDHDVRLVDLRPHVPVEVAFLIEFGGSDDANIERDVGPLGVERRSIGGAE